MITDQLRELLRAKPLDPFCIFLADGRELHVYDPFQVAFAHSTHGAREGLISVAVGTHFLTVNPEQIVSIGPIPPPSPERMRRMQELVRHHVGPDIDEPKEKPPEPSPCNRPQPRMRP